MLTDEEYDEQEAEAEYFAELKSDLADLLRKKGVEAFPFDLEGDVLVSGPLSVLMQFCQDYRSEIEELG